MKKMKHQLKVLVEALSKADVDLLMYFEEICCLVWTDEQIKGYPPLDKERWTEEDFKDSIFIQAYRKFLIDYVKQVAETNPELLDEVLEVMKSTVSQGKRLWRIVVYEEHWEREYEIEARSKSDAWFYVATVIIPVHPKVLQVKVSEVKP